jgi:sigma-E factor negative regulatory protein RseC
MIEEQAQVVAIKGNQLVLQAQTQSACGNCSASQGCGTSLLSKVIGRKFTQFQAENIVDAAVGDTVIVGISEDALLKGSLVMYVIPVFGMLVFALLAEYLLVESTQSRDLMIALSALIGLVFGAFISRWYFQRRSSVKLFSPVILRKIIEHGKLQVL